MNYNVLLVLCIFHIKICLQSMTRKQISCNIHSAKSVRIRSCSGPYFPAFGLNSERYFVSLRIQSKCGKMRTRITSNRDTLHAVIIINWKNNTKMKLHGDYHAKENLEQFSPTSLFFSPFLRNSPIAYS